MLNGDVSELRCCIYTLMVFTNAMMRHDHNTLISVKLAKHGTLLTYDTAVLIKYIIQKQRYQLLNFSNS